MPVSQLYAAVLTALSVCFCGNEDDDHASVKGLYPLGEIAHKSLWTRIWAHLKYGVYDDAVLDEVASLYSQPEWARFYPMLIVSTVLQRSRRAPPDIVDDHLLLSMVSTTSQKTSSWLQHSFIVRCLADSSTPEESPLSWLDHRREARRG